MKKYIVSLLPNIIEEATGTCVVSFSDVEVIDADYVNNRLSESELRHIDNIVHILEDHSKGISNALWNLATCYDCGITVEMDMNKAKDYYMLTNMQSLLDKGQMGNYTERNVTVVNLVNCAQAYEDAANRGYRCAMFFYGLAFLNELGVPEDDGKANYWFERASDMGLNEATNALANSYLHGYGVDKNVEKAVELLKISASHGNVNAWFNLGVTFYNAGKIQLGLEFICQAANDGHKQAIDILKQLGY